MTATIGQLTELTELQSTDLVEIERPGAAEGNHAEVSLLVLNKGSAPAIVYGTATALDASGNPTPDTSTYDPTVLPEGTLLLATTGPTAQDNGTGEVTTYSGVDMRFRVVAGAFVWDGGSFRASNSNGNYVRLADGSQECWNERLVLSFNSIARCLATWTFPAAFTDTTYGLDASYTGPTDGVDSTSIATAATPSSREIGAVGQGLRTASSIQIGSLVILGMTSFAAGDEMYVSVKAKGQWKA